MELRKCVGPHLPHRACYRRPGLTRVPAHAVPSGILAGCPTDAQLTLRLLRDAEARLQPLAPPPPAPVLESPVDDSSSIAESTFSDVTSALSEATLEDADGKKKAKSKGGFGVKLAGAVRTAAKLTEDVRRRVASTARCRPLTSARPLLRPLAERRHPRRPQAGRLGLGRDDDVVAHERARAGDQGGQDAARLHPDQGREGGRPVLCALVVLAPTVAVFLAQR